MGFAECVRAHQCHGILYSHVEHRSKEIDDMLDAAVRRRHFLAPIAGAACGLVEASGVELERRHREGPVAKCSAHQREAASGGPKIGPRNAALLKVGCICCLQRVDRHVQALITMPVESDVAVASAHAIMEGQAHDLWQKVIWSSAVEGINCPHDAALDFAKIVGGDR